MRVWSRYINFYFALAASVAMVGAGCKTDKNDKVFSALRVHVQVPRMTTTGVTVPIIRADPVLVTVGKDPILAEGDISGARVIDAQGGFALQIGFTEQAALVLEQYSAGNVGKHFAIFGQWSDLTGEKNDSTNDARWLAAPLITHRISDGMLTFTPDMSRAEADQFVLGLNNDVKKTLKSTPKVMQ